MAKNKTKSNLKSLWHSIFYGMAGADNVINAPVGSSDGTEIVQRVRGGGGVFEDLLQVVNRFQIYYL